MKPEDILAEAKSMQTWLVETRRHLHARPELGRQEFETANFIESTLRELGIRSKRLDTAVVGHVVGTGPGREGCVAFRADIDALPVTEPAGLPFQSLRPGLMHACGHDAHTAILLGVASFFARHRTDFSGTVKLLFQPDEEGEGGADIMVRAGLLEDPHAERVFGLHVQPYLEVGEIETRKGPLNGSSTSLGITVRGSSSHGAYPEKGIDAILLAAHVVLALNELVSRYVSPLDSAVLTIGTINGGSRSNIIAGEVSMKATLRSADDGLRDSLIARARAIVEGIPAAFGGSGSLEVSTATPASSTTTPRSTSWPRRPGSFSAPPACAGRKSPAWEWRTFPSSSRTDPEPSITWAAARAPRDRGRCSTAPISCSTKPAWPLAWPCRRG